MLPAVAMLAGFGCRFLWDIATVKPAAAPVAAETSKRLAGREKRLQARSQGMAQMGTVAGGFAPGLSIGLKTAVAAVIALAVVATVWMKSDFFFYLTPQEACRQTYGLNPFLECPLIAKFIAQNSEREDTVAVLGSEPEIFFDSYRNSATGYIYTYGMMEPQPAARRMQDEMIQEIEAKQPKFIVLVNVITSWLPRNKERRIFEWFGGKPGHPGYLQAYYRTVGVADMLDKDHTEYHWNEEAGMYRPRSECNVMVFCRK